MNPRPCSGPEAAKRALSIAGLGGQYLLGTGDYRPHGVLDLPWTERDGERGTDCAGFAMCWAYKVVRHRPGFAKGGDIEDDINTDSGLWDAAHARDLYEPIETPELGALLVTPTIRLPHFYKMGHVRICVGTARVIEWDPAAPTWELLDLAEACGPNRRSPGVILSTGAGVARHNRMWPKPEHRTRILRAVP